MISNTIENKITAHLQPTHLEIINESHMHSVPKDSETHFKLIIVSDGFDGQSLVQRHRTVYQLLSEELAQGVHALSLHCYTPDQWKQSAEVPDSPHCRGGSKKDSAK